MVGGQLFGRQGMIAAPAPEVLRPDRCWLRRMGSKESNSLGPEQDLAEAEAFPRPLDEQSSKRDLREPGETKKLKKNE